MKRITLVGYSEAANYGDELIFLIHLLMTRPYGRCSIFSPSSEFVEKLRLVEPDFGIVDKISKDNTDIVIFIGGGYFGPGKLIDPFWQRSDSNRKYRNVFDDAAREGIPVHILGPEVGPWLRPYAARLWDPIFRGAASIALRNRDSIEYLESLTGLNSDYSGDVVLGKVRDFLSTYSDHELARGSEERFGIHVTAKIQGKSPFSRNVRKAIIESLTHCESDKVFLFFDQEAAVPIGGPIDLLVGEISKFKSVEVVPYKDVVQLTALISTFTTVLTTKLHVGVVAAAVGAYPISLQSHPKIGRFYRQLDMSAHTRSFIGRHDSILAFLISHLDKDRNHSFHRVNLESAKVSSFFDLRIAEICAL